MINLYLSFMLWFVYTKNYQQEYSIKNFLSGLGKPDLLNYSDSIDTSNIKMGFFRIYFFRT